MAASLACQWIWNFAIAKLTPIMLHEITYGTFLLFGTLCIVMGVWVVLCVPETKGVPLESIGELFEGDIIKGCIQDTWPSRSRAKMLRHHHNTNDVDSVNGDAPNKGARVNHIEAA
jgi:SP family sugar:H+ symporter-like MFS transporter